MILNIVLKYPLSFAKGFETIAFTVYFIWNSVLQRTATDIAKPKIIKNRETTLNTVLKYALSFEIGPETIAFIVDFLNHSTDVIL